MIFDRNVILQDKLLFYETNHKLKRSKIFRRRSLKTTYSLLSQHFIVKHQGNATVIVFYVDELSSSQLSRN